MSSPTQRAEQLFAAAKNDFMGTLASDEASIPQEMRKGLQNTVDGLAQLSAGLRATYTLLEQVRKSLQDMQRAQGRASRL